MGLHRRGFLNGVSGVVAGAALAGCTQPHNRPLDDLDDTTDSIRGSLIHDDGPLDDYPPLFDQEATVSFEPYGEESEAYRITVETTIDDDHRVTDFMAANETESVRNFLYEPSRAIVEVVIDEAYDYLAGTEDHDVEEIVLVYASTDCSARHTITDSQAMDIYDEAAETVAPDAYEALFYTSEVKYPAHGGAGRPCLVLHSRGNGL